MARYISICVALFFYRASSFSRNPVQPRRDVLSSTFTTAAASSLQFFGFQPASADAEQSSQLISKNTVAYKSISLPLSNYGVEVPVACWFPLDTVTASVTSTTQVKYNHQISVQRIGELLAGWDFIPGFVSRQFEFTSPCIDGQEMLIPNNRPTIVLAHGYLGSRWDLSHYAEELASQGFVCVAAEYPESLAASYPRMEGLDRNTINNQLLEMLSTTNPKSLGGIGHSLGCGSVLQMGDESWTRILIAGRAPEGQSDSPLLFITSTNDGAVRFDERFLPGSYSRIDIGATATASTGSTSPNKTSFPKQSALILNEPNHISYLSPNVGDAMVSFLSPLLPLAQMMSIPLLDFDRYEKSRDSAQTAAILKPVIIDFLNQQMNDK